MMTKDLKTAIVTGASSGIGEAIAHRLAQNGFRVFGTSRRPGEAPASVEMIPLDVTRDDSVTEAVATVAASTGQIDVLINNAGIGVAGGAEESSVDQAMSVFDTNVFGMMRMTRAVLPFMRAAGSGRIINVSSVLGLIPSPYMAIYASTKHAMEGYSESLDHELRGAGIRIILIEPAYTKTRFGDNMAQPDRPLPEYEAARKAALDRLRRVEAIADDPDVVGLAALEAATASNPRLRYTAGKMAARVAALRRFVPAKAFDKNLRKQLGLDNRV